MSSDDRTLPLPGPDDSTGRAWSPEREQQRLAAGPDASPTEPVLEPWLQQPVLPRSGDAPTTPLPQAPPEQATERLPLAVDTLADVTQADDAAPASRAVPRLRLRRPDRDTLAVLGGARRDAITRAPGDRQSYSSMALILMFTATVAALSMAFALGMVFHAGWYWFLPIGVFWGAGIFAIDRALTIQLTSTRGFWRTLMAVVPRVGLAAILGAVVSTPVTLQIFEPEISAQIVVMEAEARSEFEQQLLQDPVIATEDAVRSTISESQAVLDTATLDPADDPTYAAAKAAEDAALADLNAKTAAWVAESNGTGGTGVAGTGPITDIARAAVDAAQATYDAAKATADQALAAAQSSLGTTLAQQKEQAATDLEKARTDLAAVEARRAELQSQNDAAVAASDGISNRLTALDRLGAESPAAALAHLMVFLLFFAIELLPVIIKLLRTLGTESVHDVTAREADEREKSAVHRRAEAARDEAALEAEMVAAHLETRRELGLHQEQLALVTGKRNNYELDQRARRRTDRLLSDWDASEEEAGRPARSH